MRIFGIILLAIVILAIIIFSLKDPDTGKSYWHNFTEAYGRFKNIYHELEKKRREPQKSREIAEAVDAQSGPSIAKESEGEKVDTVSAASSGKKEENAAKPIIKEAERVAPRRISLSEKCHDFIDAASAASFKTIDHKKLIAKLTGGKERKAK